MTEYWNNGRMGFKQTVYIKRFGQSKNFFSFQYSNIPVFQYSLDLIVDAGLRLDPLSIRMLHFCNLTHRIRQFDYLRVGIPPR